MSEQTRTLPETPVFRRAYRIVSAREPDTGNRGWQAKWVHVLKMQRPTCETPNASPVFTDTQGGKERVRQYVANVHADAYEEGRER
jgi:hypothetical protein